MFYGAMNFPIMPVLRELEDISKQGFDYMELTMDPPQAHYKTIRKKKDKLLAALDRHKMKLICHLPSFVSTADLTESIREASLKEVLHSLEVASEIHPMKIVLHPSFIVGLGVMVITQARKYAMQSLEVIVEKAESLGLELCIENMFPASNSLVNPMDFIDIFDEFPSLKLILDIGHANIGDKSKNRGVDFIKTFSERIGHIHVSDNFGKEDNHLPVGTGTVDFAKIAKALKGIGYNGTITFEIFSRDRDYVKVSREKFKTILDHA